MTEYGIEVTRVEKGGKAWYRAFATEDAIEKVPIGPEYETHKGAAAYIDTHCGRHTVSPLRPSDGRSTFPGSSAQQSDGDALSSG